MENKNNLYRWQKEAYGNWMDNDGMGIIEACTGSGKTRIGTEILVRLLPAQTISCLIAVPTVHLQQQWYSKVTEEIVTDDVGLIGGDLVKYDGEIDKRVVIAVINSLRDKFIKKDLLIIDECHRAVSDENFTFIKNGRFKFILGLTATLQREDRKEKRLQDIVPIIYSYTLDEAIRDEVVASYELINTPVELTERERAEYDSIKENLAPLFYLFGNDFKKVLRTIQTKKGDNVSEAFRCVSLFSKRRILLANSEEKIEKCIDLIIGENVPKSIIFCEYIKTASTIYAKLANFTSVCIYHSKIPLKERTLLLSQFKDNLYKVIVCVKALDEGIDIPELEVAIITAGTSVKRQQIQRIGRVLRKSGDKQSRIYQIYVEDSKETDWVNSRSIN